MCRSCHFNRATNYESGVEFWMFAMIIFSASIKIVSKRRPSYFYKGALTQKRYIEGAPKCKTRPQLKQITMTYIWHSTPISTLNDLLKWHDARITSIACLYTTGITKQIIYHQRLLTQKRTNFRANFVPVILPFAN